MPVTPLFEVSLEVVRPRQAGRDGYQAFEPVIWGEKDA
jgi:hypothetical protein